MIPRERGKSFGVSPGRAVVALLTVCVVVVASPAPWPRAPRAESERAAISRSGVLGGAAYLIEVPANWEGGLVMFAT